MALEVIKTPNIIGVSNLTDLNKEIKE